MNRLIIESIEGRILVGISMFVAIMILIGWVTINEESRMGSFVQEYEGRAIERGAEQFASKCTTCHGPDGYGISQKAPGLHNPHLFGYDPLKDFNDEILSIKRKLDPLTTEADDLNKELTDAQNVPTAERQDEIFARLDELNGKADAALSAEKDQLTAELNDTENPPTQERIDAINARIAEIDTVLLGQIGVLNAQINQIDLDRLQVLNQLTTAIGNGLYPDWQNYTDPIKLTEYLSNNGTRAAQVGWAADVRSYIITTLIHGRPGSNNVWPNSNGGMAAWSDLAGGPLRQDQIEDIATYIMNWDKGDNWTIADFAPVNQFGKPHVDGTLVSVEPIEPAGTDVQAILAKWESDGIVGDATKGERLYKGALGCIGCHGAGAVAPITAGTWDRVVNERLKDPQFAGYTPEQYVVESIVNPSAYIVPEYPAGGMPPNFGTERISVEQLADIVAFLKTQTATPAS